MKMTKSLFSALASAVLLAACAGTDPMNKEINGKPAWVVKGGGAYTGKDGKNILFGVGIANPMPNASLQRKVSDTRAREEIAATLKSSVASLTKDYMDHHVDLFNASSTAASDEMVSHVAKTVVEATLVDSRIVDRWEDEATGTVYALARMDLGSPLYEAYRKSLAKALGEKKGAKQAKAAEALKALESDIEAQRAREKELLKVSGPAPEVPAGAQP